jgi:protein TonB
MRKLALLALLAPTIAAADTRFASAIRTKKPNAIVQLLGEHVYTPGLWFPDAACARQFAKEQVIEGAARTALARCLAKLKLQASTRSPGFGGEIITFAPGFELHAGISVGAGVYHLGFVHGPSSDHLTTPTITSQALEGLRTKGSTNVDAAVAAKLERRSTNPISAWIEVCIKPNGESWTTVSDAASSEVERSIKAAVADWAFKPFQFANKPMAVCAHTLVTYPAASAPKEERLPNWTVKNPADYDEKYAEVGVEGGIADGIEGGEEGGVVGGVSGGYVGAPPPPPPPPPPAPPQNVPPTLLEAQRLAGDKVIVPDDDTKKQILKSGKDKIIGSFKLCITKFGDVSAVTMLKSSGFPAYDQKIQRGMQTWKYRPYVVNGKDVPVCTAVTFIYSQK